MKTSSWVSKWIQCVAMVLALASKVALAQAPVIDSLSDDQTVAPGATAFFIVGASSADPIGYHWFHGAQPILGANLYYLQLTNISDGDAGSYSVIVSNTFGSVTSAPVSLVVLPLLPGMLDPDFHPGTMVNGIVRSVAIDPDGRIYLGGQFDLVDGMPRGMIARLSPNGNLDTSFLAAITAGLSVYAVAVQADGQLIVGGSFSGAEGLPRHHLARFNSSGALDTTFDADISALGAVWSIAIQDDGKILIGGDFTSVGGIIRNRIARLQTNGVLDTSFSSGDGVNDSVRAMVLQPDGNILIGGAFTLAGSTVRNRIARLTSDGDVDLTFDPGDGGVSYWVNALALQPDGKVILGGNFYSVANVPRPQLARLDTNGALDLTFNQGSGPNSTVTSMALQPDGKLFIGGGFYSVNGETHPYFTRVNSVGANDDAFYPDAQANSWVETAVLQSDGKILIGGIFDFVNGQPRGKIARLLGGDPAPFAPIFLTQPPRERTVREGEYVQLDSRALAFPGASYRWLFNGNDVPGATNHLLELINIRVASAGNYQVVASNLSGSITSRLALLNVTPARTDPGAVDVDFFTGDGPDNSVRSISVQSDGSAIIGGFFYSVDGVVQRSVARLTPEGALDASFLPLLDFNVAQVEAVPSGDIWIGGNFQTVNGVDHGSLARLTTNGVLDTSFDPNFSLYANIRAFVVLTNGQVIAAGSFMVTNSDGLARYHLARLNGDGTVDATFDAKDASDEISSVAAAPGGKTLIAGAFNRVNGVPRNGIARLNSDGSLDATFDPGSGANSDVLALDVQPDGKILVGGRFRSFNGRARHQIARLNSDGMLDPTFDPGPGPDAEVLSIRVLSDGKIMIGGNFTEVNGQSRSRVARLNSDGSLDFGFDPGGGADYIVLSIAEVPDGKIMVGGHFTYFDGLPRPFLVRLLKGTPSPAAPAIIEPPEPQSVQAGDDVTFTVLASGVPEPTYQWRFQGTNIPGATQWILMLPNVHSINSGDYSVVVSNAHGVTPSASAALFVDAPSRHPGAPDISFYTGQGPNDRVHAIAVPDDRKVFIGGAFTEVDGVRRGRMARLTKSGALDSTFDPGAGANDRVFSLALQPDGKIIAGGSFTMIDGVPHSRIARLLTNGLVDSTFDPGLGADAEVYAVAHDFGSGDVLIGGRFASVGGLPRQGLARLLVNGTVVQSFAPALNLGSIVYAITIQPDGKIIAAGSFYSVGDSNRSRIARFNADGTLDNTFNLDGASSTVTALGLYGDGKVGLAGDFLGVNGLQRIRVARLLPGGALDDGFLPTAPNRIVNALHVQPDGKMVIGGDFISLGAGNTVDEYGQVFSQTNYARFRLARLETNGVVDAEFNAEEGVHGGSSYVDEYGQVTELTTVLALARDPDGKILVGGDFTLVNGITRPYIARLFGSEASDAVAVLKGEGMVQVRWDTGVLQVADEVHGPWTDVLDAESPVLYQVGEAQKFFRLKFN
ncbi:MAG TPA: immunoglobulin domain-containing protein [Candidatus Limnocylindria bacterium]|nr:immunoglobulin domain-containing protein [Candidatus Limnocylindria bacterium]